MSKHVLAFEVESVKVSITQLVNLTYNCSIRVGNSSFLLKGNSFGQLQNELTQLSREDTTFILAVGYSRKIKLINRFMEKVQ